MRSTPTWLITGASSGLGRDLAAYVLEQGHEVVLAARTEHPMLELAGRYPVRTSAEVESAVAVQHLAVQPGA
ncbi:SDR family NAD(P)-dependent oxidoreductase [Rathayibacter sp. YIM 133350]|uniref:SDR family NAD(P)-dependent oxidoreductase n=1 Tax=Rathayibacter sp. YIM 133350 TaxID=3131992 RepID=UPI00307F1158